MTNPFSLLIGWLLDLFFGDPQKLPHPIVWFGKMIAACEHQYNKGTHRKLKGALIAIGLILFVFAITWMLRKILGIFALFIFDGTREQVYQIPILLYIFDALAIFYCLAGTTLIREVREVFLALDRSLEEGRKQVARIVGRDTSELSAQEVRTAALETLAENLSDGVIAPLFWLAILGTPGMLAYKMVNTLDSMVGYKTERYRDFGCWAAHIDDIANYIPARLTALLMLVRPQIRSQPRLSQQRLSRVRPCRHPRLPLRWSPLLLRRTLRQTLHRHERTPPHHRRHENSRPSKPYGRGFDGATDCCRLSFCPSFHTHISFFP